MKLHQMQALVAVVQHGGIRAAARQVHLSQAALTKSLRQLEEEAGVPLLMRSSRGVGLTEAGQRLLARAQLVLRQVELAEDELRQCRGDEGGLVRVGLTPSVTITALGGAFNWFRQRYPQVQLQFIEGLMARVLPRLRDGMLDLAVVAPDVGELSDDEFQCAPILRTTQRIVMREGHPLLQAPSARALVDCEWVLAGTLGSIGMGRYEAMFKLAGVPLPPRVVVCEAMAALNLLRNADLVGVLPSPLLGHPETRGLVPLETSELHPSDVEVMLVSRPDVPLTPAAAYFAHCITESCRQCLV